MSQMAVMSMHFYVELIYGFNTSCLVRIRFKKISELCKVLLEKKKNSLSDLRDDSEMCMFSHSVCVSPLHAIIEKDICQLLGVGSSNSRWFSTSGWKINVNRHVTWVCKSGKKKRCRTRVKNEECTPGMFFKNLVFIHVCISILKSSRIWLKKKSGPEKRREEDTVRNRKVKPLVNSAGEVTIETI